MAHSYQDLNTRLMQLEDKLAFVMKTFSVTKQYRSRLMPEEVITETKSLWDLYREITAAGLTVLSPEEARLNNIDAESNTIGDSL